MVRCPTLCAAIPQWSAALHCAPPYTAFHQAGGNKETDAENKYLREETAENCVGWENRNKLLQSNKKLVSTAL